jgi:peptidoglycan-N-acetylglucosamine deacetylase
MACALFWHRAQAYRDLSKKLQGRDIAQVILLHHNLINALWLNDIIELFKDKGWAIVSPHIAFADPIYQFQPVSSVSGQSLLLSMTRSLGLAKTQDWDRLFDDGDYEIDALKKLGF